jgi:hypothetical protein
MKSDSDFCCPRMTQFALYMVISLVIWCSPVTAQSRPSEQPELNDSHFHLTNYIQEGTEIHDFLNIMGTKVGRVALFGIPLQQRWSYRVDGDHAPTYYLNSDAPLYCYSFTDAWIAMAYRSLSKEQQARFAPMITGFNPSYSPRIYAVNGPSEAKPEKPSTVLNPSPKGRPKSFRMV